MTTAAPKPFASKAHEYVPEFSNKSQDYKEFRKRVLLYEKKIHWRIVQEKQLSMCWPLSLAAHGIAAKTWRWRLWKVSKE